MKKLIFFLVIVTFGCNNNNVDSEINNILKDLNRKNIEYFKIQRPLFYHKIPSYIMLNQIDSLSNILTFDLKKGENNTKALNKFFKLTNTIMRKSQVQTDEISKNLNTILEVEYICGNILIEKYNQGFFKMKAVTAVVKNDKKIYLGDTLRAWVFLAGIDPDNKFVAIINKDTLPYFDEYIPYFEFIPNKKGFFTRKGTLEIRSSLNKGFSSQEFEISCDVKSPPMQPKIKPNKATF